MAWTSPPTFSSGNVLTATNLNILSDDLEYLHGFVSGLNPAVTSVELPADGDAIFIIRHLHRYLWIRYDCNADLRIYYDSTDVYHNGSPDGTITSHVVDLNSFGLTVGQLYTIKCSMNSNSGHLRRMYYVFESDVSS